jgi:hypothetical protein
MRDFIYDKSVDALKDMLHTGAKNLVGGGQQAPAPGAPMQPMQGVNNY